MLRLTLLAAVLAIGAFLLCRGVASADAEVIELRIRSPEHVTVGDRLLFIIKVEAEEGTQVSLAPGALPEELALTKTPETTTRSLGGGRIEVTLSAEVAPFAVGRLEIEPLRLRYRDAQGGTGEIETPAAVVLVESVLPAEGELAPRDLKPQAEIGAGALAWPAAAFGVALLLLAAVLGLIALRRRARPPTPQPLPVAAVAAGPEDRARAALDHAGAEFAQSRDYAAYYRAIGATVRQLLTERYGLPAFALTARELQWQMARRGLDRWLTRLAVGLLSQCDAVVYAQYRPALERADADLTAAYEIVEMGRPAPTGLLEAATP